MSASGLCHRCDHRAQFLETGSRPRFECGDVAISVGSCYMYQPVRPVVLAVNDGDKRPLGLPPMLAPRCHRVGIADTMEIVIRQHGDGHILYWRPLD